MLINQLESVKVCLQLIYTTWEDFTLTPEVLHLQLLSRPKTRWRHFPKALIKPWSGLIGFYTSWNKTGGSAACFCVAAVGFPASSWCCCRPHASCPRDHTPPDLFFMADARRATVWLQCLWWTTPHPHMTEHCSAAAAPGPPGRFRDSMSKLKPGGCRRKRRTTQTNSGFIRVTVLVTVLLLVRRSPTKWMVLMVVCESQGSPNDGLRAKRWRATLDVSRAG